MKYCCDVIAYSCFVTVKEFKCYDSYYIPFYTHRNYTYVYTYSFTIKKDLKLAASSAQFRNSACKIAFLTVYQAVFKNNRQLRKPMKPMKRGKRKIECWTQENILVHNVSLCKPLFWSPTFRWNRLWTKQSQCQCGAGRRATVGHLW